MTEQVSRNELAEHPDMTPEMMELMAASNEPLHPDLLDWVEEGQWGKMLRHPLIYSVPLTLPGMVNKGYIRKRALLEEYLRDEDWAGIVWLHERAYRLDTLIDYCTGRDDEGNPLPLSASPEYWALAADVWVDSENIGQVMAEWSALFGDCTGFWLGTDAEREQFDLLPDPIPAWRGMIDDGGWSYSTDKKIAQWFANRFDGGHSVIMELIPKDRVFGYLTRRGESELLVRRTDS